MRTKALLTLRMLGWVLIALVTLEVCARTEDALRFGGSFFGPYNIEILYYRTPFGRFGRANASYLKWHLNELGYRGPALRSPTYRIACLGSSETFGLYESPDHEWPRQLEAILNRKAGSGQPFEVVNIAYPGLSIGTSLVRLPQMLAVLHPKMVVIYPSFTPYIEIDHTQADSPQIPPAYPMRPDQPQEAQPAQWRLTDRINTLLKNSTPDFLQHRIRNWQMQRGARDIHAMDALPDRNVQAFHTDLDALVTQLRDNGVEVILVTHANRFGTTLLPADRPALSDWRKFFPTLKEDGFLDMEQRMNDVVRHLGEEHHIPVVDAATQIPRGTANFADFVHYTDTGAQLLADSVATAVLDDPRVSVDTRSSPKPATTLPPTR